MSPDEPKDPEGGQPTGESLWRILQDPGQMAETAATPSSPAAKQKVAEPPPAAPEHDASLIQRILMAPEDLGEDFVYGDTAVEAPAAEDFDRALANYYRDIEVVVKCRNHPERNMAAQCPECQAYYCQPCLVVRRGRVLCRDCAETLYVPNPEDVIAAQVRGLEAPEAGVLPEEYPEFQVGRVSFGRECAPASPLKRVLALLIDLLVTRAVLLAALFVLGLIFNAMPSPVFHLFDRGEGTALARGVFDAVVLYRPYVPWLILFAVTDYVYFFLCLALVNRTLGMSWLSCRIVSEWGDFVSYSAVAVRTLVFMVCLEWPSILLAWFFPGFRGPHDYAAGTLVINYSGVKRVDVYETVQIRL